ncbi:WecB/TagA/CpsF family glycosyltransferase [Candidatus Microgenomates bacterium]|nr:WecB/TagA/CpsF family glycosyltransferase [Candidatus Microgenomates bacterium]
MKKTKQEDVNLGHKYAKILKIGINSTTKDQVLRFVSARLEDKTKFYIVTPNPEIVLKASNSSYLSRIITDSDISVPDGVGLKYAAKFIDGTTLNIIPGRKLFWDILEIANTKSLRITLYGGWEGDTQKTKEEIEKKLKKLDIQAITPPIYDNNCTPINPEERKKHKSCMARLKIFQPDIIFIGLTTPKQEMWIRKNFFNLQATGVMTVGGTFSYIAGSSKTPPGWMESLGIEWLWRVITDPKRIKRVLNAVIVFPWKVFLWKLGVGK